MDATTQAALPRFAGALLQLDPDRVRSEAELQQVAELGADFAQAVMAREGEASAEDGLTAMVFLTYYANELTPTVRTELQRVLVEARANCDVVRDLSLTMQVLHKHLWSYYSYRDRSYNYWLPQPLPNMLAQAILDYECKRLAAHFQAKFAQQQKPGLVAQYFVHPRDGRTGVWMSVDGMTPDKVDLE